MSSADRATVVIACPHCATRYQVPQATLGLGGREVQCAQCGKSWHAGAAPPPEPDRLFGADEASLDLAFADAEKAAAAPAPPPTAVDPGHERTLAEIRAAIAPRAAVVNVIDPAVLERARTGFDLRRRQFGESSALARLRRAARLAALLLLASILVFGISQRTALVRWFPSLAGLYATLGLPVNVVGLDFEQNRTLATLRDGHMVMQVKSRIRAVADRPVPVPPVLVSLLNEHGVAIYEWTVASGAAELAPGATMNFSTEVNSPPDGTVAVRLGFRGEP